MITLKKSVVAVGRVLGLLAGTSFTRPASHAMKRYSSLKYTA